MKNLFKKTEFVFGVTSYKNLPEDIGYEILLAGRSNAGKSSALNVLTDNKKLARISKTPGRTTEINFFKVNENLTTYINSTNAEMSKRSCLLIQKYRLPKLLKI